MGKTCANSCWTASGVVREIEWPDNPGEGTDHHTRPATSAQALPRTLGYDCNLSFFSLFAYTPNMAPATDKRMIHSKLAHSFTFDKELNEQSNTGRIFVYGSEIPLNEPIRFRRNFAIPKGCREKEFKFELFLPSFPNGELAQTSGRMWSNSAKKWAIDGFLGNRYNIYPPAQNWLMDRIVPLSKEEKWKRPSLSSLQPPCRPRLNIRARKPQN